jgi:tripartite-type tricarboxylate transporter receptor subunit TctC
VGGIASNPFVLEVNPSVPAKTVSEFFAYAKAHPGKLNFASGGNGSSLHLAGELFKMMAGIEISGERLQICSNQAGLTSTVRKWCEENCRR